MPLILAAKIDANTASAAELELLPEIGPMLAQAIVAHRAQRPFHQPSDLDAVRGVGLSTLASISPHLRFHAADRESPP